MNEHLNKLINSLPSRLLMPQAQCAQIMEQWHMRDPDIYTASALDILRKAIEPEVVGGRFKSVVGLAVYAKEAIKERRKLRAEVKDLNARIEKMDEAIEALLMERAHGAQTT